MHALVYPHSTCRLSLLNNLDMMRMRGVVTFITPRVSLHLLARRMGLSNDYSIASRLSFDKFVSKLLQVMTGMMGVHYILSTSL